MAKTVVPLTDKKIKSVKPKDKNFTLTDGQGLQLLIKPDGTKLWEFRYTSPITNKRRKTSFNTYPTTSLSKAREKREEYRRLINDNIDPLDIKKEKKEKQSINSSINKNTFFKVSQEWLKNKTDVSENYHYKLERALELYIYPFIKDKPITTITRLDIIDILKDLKDKKLLETADRVLSILNRIYKYSVTLEYTPHNITADIDKRVIIGSIKATHYPTFTKEKDIKGLLLSIDDYQGDYSTKMALKTLPYVFVRSYNIRHMEWEEIDFENSLWIIPSNKMKTKTEFVLPLPHQVISILNEVKKYSSGSKYVFPSLRNKNSPLSDNTLISALRRTGYSKEEFVPHGFRSMFSTIANEKANEENGHNFTSEVVEALLAHKEVNKIKEAYNRASYKKPMKELIQWYANYLDGVKNG